MLYSWQGFQIKTAWSGVLGVATKALSLVTAPLQAASSMSNAAVVKVKLQGCVASLVALNTVWEVGKATYLPELTGYAATDFSALERVRSLSRRCSPLLSRVPCLSL